MSYDPKMLKDLAPFMGKGQMAVMRHGLNGEEAPFFESKLLELWLLTATMPSSYETDGEGRKAVVQLHYFIGGCDWYITEKDRYPEQNQAFGLADLGYGGELGYISLPEVTAAGAELDWYWAPKALDEINRLKEAA